MKPTSFLRLVRPHHFLYLLLLAVPAAAVCHLLQAGPVTQFVAAALGIVPLAAILGRATENLAHYLGPRLGGLLSATFGNAAELILGVIALHHGLVPVVKASITGSIIGNALLVLGASFLVGGLRHRRQSFNRTMVGLQSTLLVVAAIGLTVPSVLARVLPARAEVNLSEEVAAIFLATYVLSVVFSLLGHAEEAEVVSGHTDTRERPEWSAWFAAGVLIGVTMLVALLSEFLADAIEAARSPEHGYPWGMSEIFVGVVLVAVVGNAAENSTAILMAYRNKMDLALHIAIGSSLQIALLVMPILVFASLVVAPAGQALDLHFTLLEVLAVSASVIVVHLVAADGQSHWMEGVLLLAVYLILALAFYHLPEPHEGPQPGQTSNLPASFERIPYTVHRPGLSSVRRT